MTAPQLFDFPPHVRWLKCHFCGERIKTQNDGHIEIFSRLPSGALVYPRNWHSLVMVLAHTECGPDTGYHFRLDRLVGDGAESWINHLQGKNWWAFGGEDELRDAEKYARLIKPLPDLAPVKTILSAKLPRPTRSDNPRSISKGTRTWVLERDGFRCRRCNASASEGARLVVDHVVSVAKGGSGDVDNLQTLCWDCNAGKSDREPHAHDLRPR